MKNVTKHMKSNTYVGKFQIVELESQSDLDAFMQVHGVKHVVDLVNYANDLKTRAQINKHVGGESVDSIKSRVLEAIMLQTWDDSSDLLKQYQTADNKAKFLTDLYESRLKDDNDVVIVQDMNQYK